MKIKRRRLLIALSGSLIVSASALIATACAVNGDNSGSTELPPVNQDNTDQQKAAEQKAAEQKAAEQKAAEQKAAGKDNLNNNLLTIPDSRIKLEKLNLLALGDSVAAGFNGEYGYQLSGDSKNTGLSYIDFLANFVKSVDETKLETYDNYALTGSTLKDWLYLLNIDDQSQSNQTSFNFLRSLDSKEDNPFKDSVKEKFGSFSKNDLNKLHEKIKSANLITINLGANDYLNALKNLFPMIFSGKVGFGLMGDINKITSVIQSDINKVSELIKKMNPNAQVVFLSYPMPLLRLTNTLNEIIKTKISFFDDPADLILGFLNNAIKKAVEKLRTNNQNINYIDVYDKDDWAKNSDTFAPTIFDIHPGTIGYKKIAQDLFLKLFLKQNSQKELSSLIPNWDKVYFANDENKFNKLNLFNQKYSDRELVQKVYGKDEKDILLKLDELQTKFKNVKHSSMKDVVSSYVNSNKTEVKMLVKTMFSQAASFGFPLDLSSILNFINDDQNFDWIVDSLINSEVITNLLFNLQNAVNTDDLDQNGIAGTQKITLAILKDQLVKMLSKDDAILPFINTLVSGLKTKTEQQKEAIKKVVSDFLKSTFENDQMGTLLFKLVEQLKLPLEISETTFKGILKNQNLLDLINLSVNDFLENSDQYVSLTSLNQFLSKLISRLKDKQEFIDLIKKLFRLLLKDDSFKTSITAKVIEEAGLKIKPEDANFKLFKDSLANVVDGFLTKDIFDVLIKDVLSKIDLTNLNQITNLPFADLIKSKIFNLDGMLFNLNLIKEDNSFDIHSFANLVNIFFETSDTETSSLYKELFEKNFSSSSESKIGFGWNVFEKLKEVISEFSILLAREYFKESNSKIKDVYKKAIYRLEITFYVFATKYLGAVFAWYTAYPLINNWLSGSEESESYKLQELSMGEESKRKKDGTPLYATYYIYDKWYPMYAKDLKESLVKGYWKDLK
ncbi:SGNH/GDSL hydrolase family protein [Mycoplasmopsis agassizii]|uniref:SGNH/GDSL hydrolase family protein n=2 Tax=Mycoplasmopsis agassizii TaxID=33922 RepID=UPI0009D8A15B|nr:SGNH/GDSL hydrolase family protein [Mycoplasmopsis agassizii]SMC18494.1 GDSL-like Lipase/Acylhydrolase [Mycoplasmopsis agassizii]